MNSDQILATVTDVGLRVALQVLGAIVVFIVGRRLIDLAVRLVSSALGRQDVDPTLLRTFGGLPRESYARRLRYSTRAEC